MWNLQQAAVVALVQLVLLIVELLLEMAALVHQVQLAVGLQLGQALYLVALTTLQAAVAAVSMVVLAQQEQVD